MIKRILDWINKKQFERYLREAEMQQKIKRRIEGR